MGVFLCFSFFFFGEAKLSSVIVLGGCYRFLTSFNCRRVSNLWFIWIKKYSERDPIRSDRRKSVLSSCGGLGGGKLKKIIKWNEKRRIMDLPKFDVVLSKKWHSFRENIYIFFLFSCFLLTWVFHCIKINFVFKHFFRRFKMLHFYE